MRFFGLLEPIDPAASHYFKTAFEAQSEPRHAFPQRCLHLKVAQRVIPDQVHPDLLTDHVQTLVAEDLHPDGAFKIPKRPFDLPATKMHGFDFLDGIGLFIRHGRGDDNRFRTIAEVLHREGDLSCRFGWGIASVQYNASDESGVV